MLQQSIKCLNVQNSRTSERFYNCTIYYCDQDTFVLLLFYYFGNLDLVFFYLFVYLFSYLFVCFLQKCIHFQIFTVPVRFAKNVINPPFTLQFNCLNNICITEAVRVEVKIFSGYKSAIGPFITADATNCQLRLSKRFNTQLHSIFSTPVIHKIICLAIFPVFRICLCFPFSSHLCHSHSWITQPKPHNICELDKYREQSRGFSSCSHQNLHSSFFCEQICLLRLCESELVQSKFTSLYVNYTKRIL